MNFDIGEVLSQSWQITWKNKVLWWFGGAFGLFFSLIFPLAFGPMFFLPALTENVETPFAGGLLIADIVALVLLMLAMYPISAVIQTAITLGVLNVVQGGEKATFRDLLKKSLPLFWRVLGLMLIYAAAVTLIVIGIQAVIILISILTLGIGMICAMPLMLLMYPAMYLSIVWMEQAMNGIVLDDMRVMDAIRQGWRLVRGNLLAVGLIAIVLYFGIGMVMSIFMIPMMSPIFMMPFLVVENEINWFIISISLLVMAIFVPVYAIVFGWSFAFSKSTWVLTYLRITRSPNTSQPILQPVTV